MIKIELEGTDGSSKTTSLKYIIEKLRAAGKTVLETREVGSPHVPINVKLRELVLSKDSGLSGESMEMIFCAMRFEHDKFLQSVKDDYDFVVSDRGYLSHLAYTDHNVNEGFTQDLYMGVVEKRTDMPDYVIYFNIDSKTGLARRVKRGEGEDVIEIKGVEFQDKVRESFGKYIEYIEGNAKATQVFEVDANGTVEQVREQLDNILEYMIQESRAA